MRKDNPVTALKALTEWWRDMGVDDHDYMVIEKHLIQHRHVGTHLFSQSDTGNVETGSPSRMPDDAGKQSPVFPRQQADGHRSLEERVGQARALAVAAGTLPALKRAIESFDGAELKKLCAKTVVYDGTAGAPVLVLGEGPGQQEDRVGLPFVGKAGQLLDKMLASIGLDRKVDVLISNVNYWRPPGNRNPEADELAVCRPFVERMITLACPLLIIAAGNVAVKSLLATSVGITRLRGTEHVFTPQGGSAIPLIPIFHPAYLLRRPEDKAHAWRDLLLIQTRLNDMQTGPGSGKEVGKATFDDQH